jgi:hypothetical protein
MSSPETGSQAAAMDRSPAPAPASEEREHYIGVVAGFLARADRAAQRGSSQ